MTTGPISVNCNDAIFAGPANSTVRINQAGHTASSVAFNAIHSLSATATNRLNNINATALNLSVAVGVTVNSASRGSAADNVLATTAFTNENSLGLALNIGAGGVLNQNASSTSANAAVDKFMLTINGGGRLNNGTAPR